MRKYCSNCGTEFDGNHLFCSNCGQEIDQSKNTLRYDVKKKKSSNGSLLLVMLCFIVVVLIIIFINIGGYIEGNHYSHSSDCDNNDNYYEESVNEIQSYQQYSKESKCKELTREYYDSHFYMRDIYDCDDMACDMWNILKAEGIESDIVIGNLDNDIYRGKDKENIIELIKRSNHAWLLADIEGGCLAIECTSGYVVYYEDNTLYYRGLYFDNPKDFRRYSSLINEYDYQYMEYDSAVKIHNNLIDWYNNLDPLSQAMNKNTITVSENNLNREMDELNRIINEISSLIK